MTPSGRASTIAWVLSTVPVCHHEPSVDTINPSPYQRSGALGYGTVGIGRRITSSIRFDNGCHPGLAGSRASRIRTRSAGVAVQAPAAASTSM